MYKQNLNTMKKIFGLVAVAAIAALNVCVAVNSYSSDLKKFLSENESLAKIYECEGGTEVVRGGWFENWKEVKVTVTCQPSIFSKKTYDFSMIQCGLGEGDCWFDQGCWLFQ